MAAITANTGSNNWNTNGAWVGGVQPGAGDDVTIPASAVVTIPTATTVLARSVTVAASATLAFASTTAVLTIGDGTAGAGNVALSISSSATITLTGNGTINFSSTSATQQTIATGGKTLPGVNFNGAGSSYLLSSSLTSSTNIIHTAGTFDTGNQAVSCLIFNCGNSTARTLTLGSSTISVASTGTAWTATNTTNLTVTTNTATVSFTSSAGTTGATQAINWQGLSFSFASTVTTAAVTGNGTLKHLTYNGGSVKTSVISFSSTPTFTGTLTIGGQSATNRILMQSSAVGTSRTITVTTSVALSNADFMDITAAGGAGTWTGSSMGDCLGNSNITFDSPATQTHTASAGGNWSDVTKWTSRVPLPQDNVVINGSTTGTITADMPRLGASIDFTGFTGTASFASVANASFGSITLASGMTLSGTQLLTLSGRGTHTITCNGNQFSQGVTIDDPGATSPYTLADAFSTAGAFSVYSLITAGLNITCSTFRSNFRADANITLTTSTINLTSTATATVLLLDNSNTTVSNGSATYVIATASANTRTVSALSRTLPTLTYTVAGSTGTLVIGSASTTIGTLNFSDASNARTLQFTAGTTTTILAAFNVNGTPGKLMSVQSSTAATHTLSKSSGVVACDYLSLTNSIAQGGANWYAGANSTDGGGNTGWIFTAAVLGNFFRMF